MTHFWVHFCVKVWGLGLSFFLLLFLIFYLAVVHLFCHHFSTDVLFASLSKNSWAYLYRSVSGFSGLFHCSGSIAPPILHCLDCCSYNVWLNNRQSDSTYFIFQHILPVLGSVFRHINFLELTGLWLQKTVPGCW